MKELEHFWDDLSVGTQSIKAREILGDGPPL